MRPAPREKCRSETVPLDSAVSRIQHGIACACKLSIHTSVPPTVSSYPARNRPVASHCTGYPPRARKHGIMETWKHGRQPPTHRYSCSLLMSGRCCLVHGVCGRIKLCSIRSDLWADFHGHLGSLHPSQSLPLGSYVHAVPSS